MEGLNVLADQDFLPRWIAAHLQQSLGATYFQEPHQWQMPLADNAAHAHRLAIRNMAHVLGQPEFEEEASPASLEPTDSPSVAT